MKKNIFILLAALAATQNVFAQGKMIVEKTDGTQAEYNVEEIARVYFAENGSSPAEMVDLDLPSGIKWASCNLGASTPEEYGDYYAWGETSPKSDYSWSNYLTAFGATIKNADDCGTSKDPLADYVKKAEKNASAAGVADGIGGTDYDAARMKWGGKWRMPTRAEIRELIDNCTWTWTTQNGVNGRLVTSKTNGNSIFLPAAGYHDGTNFREAGNYGYYWTSSPRDVFWEYALDLYFYSEYFSWSYDFRSEGQSIRPVSE